MYESIEQKNKVYDNIVRCAFAPRPYAKGFIGDGEKITGDYKVPQGLTEEQAILAVMGAVMDERVMEQMRCESSSGMNGNVDWLRIHLIRDFLGNDEKRSTNYHSAINDGRQLAIKAFEEFENGHPEKVYELINRSSQSIISEYKNRPLDNDGLWGNERAAMKLVKEASKDSSMKAVTGFDATTEKFYNEKEAVAELKDRSMFIADKFDADKSFAEKEDYEELLAEKAACDLVVDRFNSEVSSMFSKSADNATVNMIPEDDEGAPDYSHYMWKNYKNLRQQAYIKYYETHPNKAGELYADKEKGAAAFEELKAQVKNSRDFRNAVSEKKASAKVKDVNPEIPDGRSPEKLAADNLEWENFDRDIQQKYKEAFTESLNFEDTAAKRLKEITAEYGFGEYKIVNRDVIVERNDSVSKYLRQQEPIYLADVKTGKLLRIQAAEADKFTVHPVDKIPQNPSSSTLNMGNLYSNAASKALPELDIVRNYLRGDEDSQDQRVKLMELRDTMTLCFIGFNQEKAQAIVEKAAEFEQSCEGLSQEIRDKVHECVENITKDFNAVPGIAADYSKQISDYKQNLKFANEQSRIHALAEHEKLAETGGLKYGDKAAGNLNLEFLNSASKYLSAVRSEIEDDPRLKENFAGLLDNADRILAYEDGLYTRNTNGELPPYTSENQAHLLSMYSKALYEMRAANEAYAVSEDRFALKQLISDMDSAVRKDVDTISKIVPDGVKSLAEGVDGARIQRVNVAGADFSKVGAVSNVRSAMTITRDGREVRGFFTEEKKFEGNKELIMKAAADTLSDDDTPEKFCGIISQAVERFCEKFDFAHETIQDLAIKIAKEKGVEGKFPDEDTLDTLRIFADNFVNNDTFSKVFDSTQTMFTQYNAAIEADRGSNITNRNVAMSRVANLLGVPGIIANSEELEIQDGDRVIKGVFMENAVGKSYGSIMPEDVAALDENAFDNPQLLKDCADIQILDYICQNVDRHQDNIFYKFSPDGRQIVGIQGIDNDLSFGNTKPRDDEYITLADNVFDKIKVVSADVNERLMSINKDILKSSLGSLGLTDREIESANDRLTRIKDAITAGKIQVLTDEQFRQSTLNGLAEGKLTNSQFGRLNKIKQNFASNAQRNFEHKQEKEAEIAENPELAPKEFKFEKVETLDGISQERFRLDGEKMAEFASRIAASQKSIWGKGSPQFRELGNAINSYKEALEKLPKEPSDADYRFIQAKLEVLGEKADAYLASKNPNDKNKKTQERLKIAKDLKQFSFDRTKEFKETLHRKDEIAIENANAKLKSQAVKLKDLQAAGDLKQQELVSKGLNDRVAKMQADAYVASERLKMQQNGDLPMEPASVNAELVSKIVLNDIINRERISDNGADFKLDEGNARTYIKGKFELLVINGSTDKLTNIIKQLDVVQKSVENLTPETMGNVVRDGLAMNLTNKVLTEISQNGDHCKEIIQSQQVNKVISAPEAGEAGLN